MPTPEEILTGLSTIAQSHTLVAIAWHVGLGALIAALIAGWRPDRRLAGLLLALPLASVSALAWVHNNPFNGSLFALFAFNLVVLAVRLPAAPVAFGTRWAVVTGALMLLFGWVYPHFLDPETPLVYLYAAPTGLVPCPSLSAVIGLALMLGGLQARVWPLVLAVAGLFYGVFGALRLGVAMDGVLIGGALALGVAAVRGSSAVEASFAEPQDG